jgi:hypothetical protein
MLVFIHFNVKIVGVTGFEPATTRPPDVYATGLRHTPMWRANLEFSSNFFSRPLKFYSPDKLVHSF